MLSTARRPSARERWRRSARSGRCTIWTWRRRTATSWSSQGRAVLARRRAADVSGPHGGAENRRLLLVPQERRHVQLVLGRARHLAELLPRDVADRPFLGRRRRRARASR